MKMHIRLLILAIVFCSTNSAHLPSNFLKCKRDGKLSQCLQKAIVDALPKLAKGNAELKFPNIDPLVVPSLIIGEGNGTVHVTQQFKNINFVGTSASTLDNVKVEATAKSLTMVMDAFVSEFQLLADYNMTGRILVLPVRGNGKCSIKLKDLTTHLQVTGEAFDKKGITYMDIKSVKLTLTPKKVEYNFENLFDGDERLGTELNKVLNEHWKDVFNDVRSGYEESMGLIYKEVANQLFHKVPYDEILPLK